MASENGVVDKQLIIHFNDVSRRKDPCGGATRFAAKLRKVKARGENAMVVFSGDALYPSMLSVGNQGRHQAEILEAIGADVACLGNHDLDGGDAACREIFQKYMPSIPVLCANLLDKKTGEPICGCKRTLVKEVRGVRYGYLGVVEEDWLATLGAVDPETIQYVDFVEEARRLAKQLLEEDRCDVIIAVTHSREANDFILAEAVDDIDIIAGGHDHHYSAKVINNCLVLNSGTDYRDFTEIWIKFPEVPAGAGAGAGAAGSSSSASASSGGRRFPPGSLRFEHLRHEVFSADPEAEDVKKIVDFHTADLRKQQAARIATVDAALDSRAPHIRGRETAVGNFVADVIRKATKADVVLINGGSLRADEVQGPGDVTLGDLMRLCPMQTGLPTIGITGAALAEALDHAVSSVPRTAGSFPVVSGLSFSYDASKEPGSRVDKASIVVGGEPLDASRRYTVTTTDYMFGGGDGFAALDHKRDEVEVVNDLENAPILPVLLRNHFRKVDVANAFIAVKEHKEEQEEELRAIAHKMSAKVKQALSRGHAGGGAAESGAEGGPEPAVEEAKREDGAEGGPEPAVEEAKREDGAEGGLEPAVEEAKREDGAEGGPEPAVEEAKREDGGGGGDEEGGVEGDREEEEGGEEEGGPAASGAGSSGAESVPLAAEFKHIDMQHPHFGIQISPAVEGRIVETSGMMTHLLKETTENVLPKALEVVSK